MNSSDSGTIDVTFLGVLLFAVAVGGALLAVQAGVVGPTSPSGGSAGQSAAVGASETPSAGTQTPVPSESTDDANVTVVFEQWGTNVSVAVVGGADRSRVDSYRITGATVQGTLDPGADYPRVTGTVEPPTTVTVVATFEDGEEQVVGTLDVS